MHITKKIPYICPPHREQGVPAPSVHPLPSDRLRIFMAAGEVSGDRQAGHLARAILALDPSAILYGSGGERMREACSVR